MASLDFSKVVSNVNRWKYVSVEFKTVDKEGHQKGRKYANVFMTPSGLDEASAFSFGKTKTFFAPEGAEAETAWKSAWEHVVASGTTRLAGVFTLSVPDHGKRANRDLPGICKAGEFIKNRETGKTKRYNTISVFALCDDDGVVVEDIPKLLSTIWERDCKPVPAPNNNSANPTPAPTAIDPATLGTPVAEPEF